ncbi:adenylosuccinate synthetase, partial [Frankia sp. AvcI1]
TGRARRTGWFDAVIARYAVRVNGLTDLFLTKLDVLSGFDRVPICVGYDIGGERVDEMPMTQTEFHHARPIYTELPGWQEDLSDVRKYADLPAAAKDYIRTLEGLSGAPVSAIGVGPGRDQTLVINDLV